MDHYCGVNPQNRAPLKKSEPPLKETRDGMVGSEVAPVTGRSPARPGPHTPVTAPSAAGTAVQSPSLPGVTRFIATIPTFTTSQTRWLLTT